MPPFSTPYRVLIVDDEPQILRVLRPVLTSDGYDVDSAETGLDSLERFEAARPDAVILDLGLPDIDGEEVIRRMREKSDAPIVVLSARQEPEDKIAALDAGANDYVHKPFHMGELSARLRNALRYKDRMRAQRASTTPIICASNIPRGRCPTKAARCVSHARNTTSFACWPNMQARW